MKLKRDELKALLKECILEMMEEGKFPSNANTPMLAPGVAQQQVRISNPQGETSQFGVTPNSRLNEAVKVTTQLISKGDPKKASLFQDIVADTARTTLQKQLSAQMSGGAITEGAILPEEKAFDQAQLEAFVAKDRWAQLAFGNKGKIKTG